MSTGFYGWIREGVKRAVLLGVSDAVEQLGAPTTGEDISPQLLSILRGQSTPLLGESATAAATASPGIQSRKRLGRTLGQVQAQGSPAAT
jgi:hypothetical protein